MARLHYRVETSLGFDLALGPANFPLVNAAFQGRYLYTANGAMQVQDLETDEVRVLDPRPDLAEAACGGDEACEEAFNLEFAAVTVAVNEARQAVVFPVQASLDGRQRLVGDPLEGGVRGTVTRNLRCVCR